MEIGDSVFYSGPTSKHSGEEWVHTGDIATVIEVHPAIEAAKEVNNG